ncbi:sodium/solute symporter [Pontiellaceae bacterium B12227]|nr:sodium/solute symporter [Pontiellaceae bacterium B12227]
MNKVKMLCGVLTLAGSAFAVIDVNVLEMAPQGEAAARTVIQLENSSAATAVYERKVAVVGGIENGKVLDQAVLLENGHETQLPVFPHPVAQAGAAMLDNHLFVLGGFQSLEKKIPTKELWSLDLSDFSKGWKKHEDLLGAGRLFPTMISFNGELHVFGGTDGQNALSDSWGFRMKPLDGTTRIGWRKLKDVPRSLSGAAAYQTGHVHAALLGGEPASDQIHIYHTVTDTWIDGGQLPQPVGRSRVAVEGDLVVLLSGNAPPMELILTRKVKTLSAVDYAVMVVYFLLMAGVGVWFARKQNSSEEFALGNRNVKWWAAGISMFATGASSISFMAIPALTYRTNLVWFVPVLAMIPCYFLQAYVIFPLLRRLQLTSTYEYLERRYHPALRLLASFQCIALQVFGRMSVVLLLPALAISAVTGMSVSLSVLLMGLLTTIYTSIGGFEAVIWTDVIQGILMLFGALLMSFMAIKGLSGGWGEFVEVGQTFGRFDMAILSFDHTLPIIWMFVMVTIVQQLTIVSDQPTVQRVFSTPMKDVRRVAGMGVFCGIAIAMVVNLAGLSIFAYFHAHPEQLDPGMTNAQVVPLYIVQRLPIGIAGLIVAALFAASMSTLSSSMNSVATLVAEDFYRRINKSSTDRQRLVLMKGGSIVVGCVGTGMAYFMAQLQIESMFQVWNEILALIGGGFVGIYILGMFTRRASSVGAVAGAVGSVVCTVLLKNLTDAHWVFYTPVATGSCIAIGYVVSLVVPDSREKSLAGLTVFDSIKTSDAIQD